MTDILLGLVALVILAMLCVVALIVISFIFWYVVLMPLTVVLRMIKDE